MESPGRSYLWSILLMLCAYGHAAITTAHSQTAIDPGRWYRLANAFLGEDRALEVDSAEKNVLYMGRARESAGQLWNLHPIKGGWYQITNQHLGEGWALGIDPEDPDVPAMAPADGSPRQLWKLTPLADGYWRLTSQGLGKGWALDTYGDGDNAPFMGETGDYSGQFWKLSPQGFVGASGTATGGGPPSGQVGAAATSVTPAQLVSAYHQLAPGVQGATLGKYAVGTLAKYCYQVQGVPFDTRTGFAYGPATHQNIYGQCRQFFALDLGPQLGVVWQDQKSGAINLTRLRADLKGQATAQITLKKGMRLAAAASDQKAIYLLLIQDGGEEDQKSKPAILQKADLAGKILMEKAHESGPSGLNIAEFGEDNIASMALNNGNIGVILGRTMHKSEDGLNHQGGIGVVFSAANLTLIANLGQTSGHSFDSYLTTAASGDFLGIDLGDNYPRGVHLHQFSASEIRSQVVYTFKTAHGEEAANPAGVTFARYAAASVGGKTFFKWSNDNSTYTELGAVVERVDGYLVFFIGEPDAQGKSLNNSRLGEALVDARNVGLVKVQKDFGRGEDGGENWDVVPSEIVLSNGPVEEGGFYDFNGGWNAQRNAGVNWITHYRNPKTENASRLRAVPLSADTALLLWEVWGPEEYHTSYAVRVDAAGQVLGQPVDLGSEVRINRRDDVLVKNGTAYLVMGNAAGKQLELVVLNP